MDGASIDGKGNSAVGYGASLGYTHQSGFGLSADYLGFNNKWNSGGNNYDASFHALTLTPSYRFALDRGNQWGLRLGLGVGLSLSDITWGSGGKTANALTTTNNPAGKMAGGATFFSMALTGTLKAGCGANSALQRAYSDSLGGTGNVTLTGNKCENNTLAVADGLTDLEIANLFTPNTGVAKDSSNPITISSGKSSYGVWRRLFTDVMAASTSWGQVAAGGFTAFETRAEYITRCTTSSCERQAATEAGALAAANIVNSDDPKSPTRKSPTRKSPTRQQSQGR